MDDKKKLKAIRAVLLMIVFICLILIARECRMSASHRAQQEELKGKLEMEETGGENKGTGGQDKETGGEKGADHGNIPGREIKAVLSRASEEISESSTAWIEKTGEANREELKEREKEPVILGKYAGLYEENPDLAGWLSIEGMKIDYPVMQCEDDEYYLHRDFYGNEDKYGCLYVRERADVNTPGTNFVIYGHNMRDGSMFGDLDLYKDEEFFLNIP